MLNLVSIFIAVEEAKKTDSFLASGRDLNARQIVLT